MSDTNRKIAGTLTLKGDEKQPVVTQLRPMGSVKGRLLDLDKVLTTLPSWLTPRPRSIIFSFTPNGAPSILAPMTERMWSCASAYLKIAAHSTLSR